MKPEYRLDPALSDKTSATIGAFPTRKERQARREAMIAARASGMKLESIAEQFGVHHSTVLYNCDEGRRKKVLARAKARVNR